MLTQRRPTAMIGKGETGHMDREGVNTRADEDGPHDSEPRSSKEDDTRADISPTLTTTPTGGYRAATDLAYIGFLYTVGL
ncbi:hypothetical protein TNCV_2975461 [Trichonephila clavipes]|nr:hypothetical protein TNCV_2975461 [Trichonephila clavipes]